MSLLLATRNLLSLTNYWTIQVFKPLKKCVLGWDQWTPVGRFLREWLRIAFGRCVWLSGQKIKLKPDKLFLLWYEHQQNNSGIREKESNGERVKEREGEGERGGGREGNIRKKMKKKWKERKRINSAREKKKKIKKPKNYKRIE